MNASPNTEKRRRVRQACDVCRSKRAKCNGVQPVCSTCKLSGANCTYSSSTKKRGLKTGYLHLLERKGSLLEAVLGSILSMDNDVKSVEEHLYKILSKPDQNGFSGKIGGLRNVWINSPAYKAFNEVLDGFSNIKPENLGAGVSTERETSTATATTTTTTTDFKDELLISQGVANGSLVGIDSANSEEGMDWLETKMHLEPRALQYHGLSGLISGFSPEAIATYNSGSSNAKSSPFRVSSIFHVKASYEDSVPKNILLFPLNSPALINAYFGDIHPWLPMLNRVQLIRYMHRSPELKNVKVKSKELNSVALVWTVLALGQFVCDGRRISGSGRTTTGIYANNAVKALENAGDSTIETIQSMLLLGYYHYCQGDWDLAWVLTSSSSRMAVDVRLMNSSTEVPVELLYSTATNPPDDSSKERTWGVAFALNTLLSARMGRTPVIRALDWPIVHINEDCWEEWDFISCNEGENIRDSNGQPVSARCLSTFNFLLRIIYLLNMAITSTIDTKGVSDTLFTPNVVSFEYLEGRLLQLKDEFPAHCRLDLTNIETDVKRLPPYILLTHFVFGLASCVIAIRLREVDVEEGYKYSKARRDKCFTDGVNGMKLMLRSLDEKKSARIPFFDYYTTICLSFPLMLSSEVDPLPHKALELLLEIMSKYSSACNISREIIQISNHQKNRLNCGQDSMARSNQNSFSWTSQLLGLPNNRDGFKFEPPKNNLERKNLIQDIPPSAQLESKENESTILNTKNPLELSNIISTTPVFGNSATNFQPSPSPAQELYFRSMQPINSRNDSSTARVQEPVHDDLEAFMLASDIHENGSKQDQFLKNLGYVGEYKAKKDLPFNRGLGPKQ